MTKFHRSQKLPNSKKTTQNKMERRHFDPHGRILPLPMNSEAINSAEEDHFEVLQVPRGQVEVNIVDQGEEDSKEDSNQHIHGQIQMLKTKKIPHLKIGDADTVEALETEELPHEVTVAVVKDNGPIHLVQTIQIQDGTTHHVQAIHIQERTEIQTTHNANIRIHVPTTKKHPNQARLRSRSNASSVTVMDTDSSNVPVKPE